MPDGEKRLRRRHNKVSTGSTAKERGIGEIVGGESRVLEASEWLRTSNNHFTYVPQVHDEVVIARGVGLEPILDKASFKRLGMEVLAETSLGNLT